MKCKFWFWTSLCDFNWELCVLLYSAVHLCGMEWSFSCSATGLSPNACCSSTPPWPLLHYPFILSSLTSGALHYTVWLWVAYKQELFLFYFFKFEYSYRYCLFNLSLSFSVAFLSIFPLSQSPRSKITKKFKPATHFLMFISIPETDVKMKC